MTLKQLIYKKLIENDILSERLATYYGKPAVFDTEAPGDQEEGWDNKTQYPRCDYIIDTQANEERSSVGTLSITVYTERTSMVILALSAAIKEAFRDVILNPEGEDGPYSFAWARTDGFTLPGTDIIGQTTQFDIVEYPDQTTTDPDPQITLSRYLKKLFPDSIVLGIDHIGEITESSKQPILYTEVRSLVMSTGHNLHTITWLDCQMTVHVLCPSKVYNLKMCAALEQELSMEGELVMDDGSLMRINAVTFDRKADYLRIGQITVVTHYGVVKTTPKPHAIEDINVR